MEIDELELQHLLHEMRESHRVMKERMSYLERRLESAMYGLRCPKKKKVVVFEGRNGKKKACELGIDL